jgi:hypothetical protein
MRTHFLSYSRSSTRGDDHHATAWIRRPCSTTTTSANCLREGEAGAGAWAHHDDDGTDLVAAGSDLGLMGSGIFFLKMIFDVNSSLHHK